MNFTKKFFAPDDIPGQGEEPLDFSKLSKPEDFDKQLDNLDNSGKLDDELLGRPETPPEKEKVEPDNLSPEDLLNSEPEPETEKKPDEPAPSTTPEPEKEPDKVIPEDKAVVTEDFISKLKLSDDEDKNSVLRENLKKKFLGKSVEELVKSYVNLEGLLGKKREELVKIPDVELPKTTIKNIPEKPDSKEAIENTRDEIIYNELRAEYPDLPKEVEERKKWLSDLGYEDFEKATEFVTKRNDVTKQVNDVWQFTDKLSKEYPDMNANIIRQEINSIKNYFEENVGLDPKTLGYDFTIDENGNNAIIDGLVTMSDNPENFDPKVVRKFNNIPLIQQGTIMRKFFENELPKIFQAIKTQSRADGATAINERKPVPSLVSEPGRGKQAKETTANQIKEINSIDQLDQLLDQEDSKDWQ